MATNAYRPSKASSEISKVIVEPLVMDLDERDPGTSSFDNPPIELYALLRDQSTQVVHFLSSGTHLFTDWTSSATNGERTALVPPLADPQDHFPALVQLTSLPQPRRPGDRRAGARERFVRH